ncbi:MAG: hypothetical protein HQK57_02245 [Deltaproteobacteria bacterium]|nr:hypothetical protein [Deltaproteobacteria bacterium]
MIRPDLGDCLAALGLARAWSCGSAGPLPADRLVGQTEGNPTPTRRGGLRSL